jgi:hypothetical protein
MAGTALVTFTATDGIRWSVRELAAVPGNGDRPCLIFECDGAFRRVRAYPEAWRDLSEDALQALSWKV